MNVGKRPGIKSFLLLILLAVLGTAPFVQAAESVAGKWRTEAEGPGGKVILILNIQQDASGRWTGTVRNNREPDRIREVQQLDVSGSDVRFHIDTEVPNQNITVRSKFVLRLDDMRVGDITLRGTVEVTAPGMQQERPIEFRRVVEQAGASAISFQVDRPMIGAWSARPDDDDKLRELQIEVLPDAENYKGTLTDTSIDETVAIRDLVIRDTSISFNFRFDGAPFMSSFWGRYDPDRDELKGSMSIGGRSQRMTFKRTSPGPDDIADEFSTKKAPLPRKHAHKFAVTARAGFWVPLYVMKDNVRNINDITSSSWAFDLGLRYHLIDYLAVQLRYSRGGVGFDTNQQNLDLFDPETGPQGAGMSQPLTTDSFIPMDSFEFVLNGYVGQNWFPTSKFNPYFTLMAGRTTWELTSAGRGTEVIAIFEDPVEGTDWTFGGGLGTEYTINDMLGLEFEWLWAYTMAEDAQRWADTDYQWTSQHVYRFSLGLTVRFF